MTRWFTADMHLGHANIIRYCDRPFADVEAMNRALVARWNDTVADGDDVWVLGDVALGNIDESLRLVRDLAGTKLLVPGNHDRCWPGRGPTADEWAVRYHDAGFAEIRPEVLEVTIGGMPARACHFPYEGDSRDEERFESHRPIDDGRLLLHGHVHTRWRVNGHQINVGVDVWDYRPVSDDQILDALRGEGEVASVDDTGDQPEP
jgi:calcineurin-like phosphoesterase family protein